MRIDELILKLAQHPAETEVVMEGCNGREFDLGFGSHLCEGEDEFADIKEVRGRDGIVILKR